MTRMKNISTRLDLIDAVDTMTRRERLERKIERRLEWAEGRDAKASVCEAAVAPLKGDWAFATQPGRIPERDRINATQKRGWEHEKMADHHRAVAEGVEKKLNREIFADDVDAAKRLRERIAEREAERDRQKLVNRLYRKGDAEGLANLGLNLDRLRAAVAEIGLSWVTAPYNPTALTTKIRRDQKRLAEIES